MSFAKETRTEQDGGAAPSSDAHVYHSKPGLASPRILPLVHEKCHREHRAARPWQAPLSPVIHNPTNWRKPVDGEGRVGLPDDHRWDGNRGGLPALTPLLIHKIQIAMHPGHLVRGEAVGAVIICGDKKRNRRGKDINLQRAPRPG